MVVIVIVILVVDTLASLSLAYGGRDVFIPRFWSENDPYDHHQIVPYR